MITLAMMCKFMRTTPSQLRYEDYEEMRYLTHIFRIMSEKNPLM